MTRVLSAPALARLVGEFDRAPAYRGLRAALQKLIADGRIPAGTRLPSERAVTAVLGVSRTTVTRAYAELVAAGFGRSRQGSGTFVAVPVERRRAHDRALQPPGLVQPGSDVLDLNIAAGPAPPGVAAAYQRAVAALPAYLGTDGYLPSGLPDLQEAVAESFTGRGLPTGADQVVITSGALSAIAIVARALGRPGDRVLVESPVYPNAVQALRLGGSRLVTAPLADPLGESGWDLDEVESTLRQTSPHLAYLIPDFQNPTGFLMSEADRERYAAAVGAARATAIVDETLQATGLDGHSMPQPFASFARDAVTIGSASKAYWGGLRVGWIRAPRAQVARIVAARVQLDLGSSLLDQLVVRELLTSPEVLAARRTQLRERRDRLARALTERLPGWRFRLPAGGLALWVQLPEGSATRLTSRLEQAGVFVAPGPVFAVEGGSDGWLRIPYARPEDELEEAVRQIAHVWTTTEDRVGGPARSERVLVA